MIPNVNDGDNAPEIIISTLYLSGHVMIDVSYRVMIHYTSPLMVSYKQLVKVLVHPWDQVRMAPVLNFHVEDVASSHSDSCL